MQVHCDTCNAMVRADDMDLATGLAKCRFCHSVFALPVGLASVRVETPAPERPGVAGYGVQPPSYAREAPAAYGSGPAYEMPARMGGVDAYGVASSSAMRMARGGALNPTPGGVIVSEHDGLSIDQRWFSAKHIAMLVFSVIWWGFLVVWYGISFATDTPLLFKLFPLIHVAAGVFIGYMSLCGFVNHTILTVRNGMLRVRHGPLPWPGNKDVRTADIAQIYCEERRHQGKNGVSYTYRLSAVLKSGSSEVLMDGVDSPDVPRFVEERVERMLDILDAPVTGEMRK